MDALLEAFRRRRRRAQVVPQSARAGGFAHLAGSAARLPLAHEAFWRWPEPATGTLRQKSYLEHPLGSQMRTRIPFVGGLYPQWPDNGMSPHSRPKRKRRSSLGHYLAVQHSASEVHHHSDAAAQRSASAVAVRSSTKRAAVGAHSRAAAATAVALAAALSAIATTATPTISAAAALNAASCSAFRHRGNVCPFRQLFVSFIGAMSVRFVSFIGRVSVREAALLSLVLALMTLLISAH